MASYESLVPIEDFITFLTPYTPDAPDNVIEHAVREAIVWFARDSRILEDTVEVHFQKGVRDYILDLPDGRELVALDWSKELLRRLSRGPGLDIAKHFLSDIFQSSYFCPNWHKDGRHPVVIFDNCPTRNCSYHLWYSWAPSRDFCSAPKNFYEEWMEAIRHKALYFLFSMPGNEWSDINLSQLNEQSAEKWLEKARRRRFADYTQGDRRLHARSFVGRNFRYSGNNYFVGGV